LFIMRSNPAGRFAGTRIHQPKVCFAPKFFMQLANCRCVAIGNRAIGANKEQYHHATAAGGEWIDSFAVQILRRCASHGLRSAWQRSKSAKQECHANNSEHRYLRGIHDSAKRPVQATSILHASPSPVPSDRFSWSTNSFHASRQRAAEIQ
jgi:hypothetical protein